MGRQLVLGIHQPRHDVPIGPTERSLRLLVKAMHVAGVEITEELIHGLAIVVEHWPRPYEADAGAPEPGERSRPI